MRQEEPVRGTPVIAALSRSLTLLEALLTDRVGRSVAAVAAAIGVPRATAHRQVTTLMRDGYIRRLPNGRLVAGHRLVALVQFVDRKLILATAAAPVLDRLATRIGCVVHLGTLENDMVTYRIKAGQGAGDFFTRVGLQLEAYCTGIGKVLLASQPKRDRDAYLAAGPFPALTAKTITDPADLRAELDKVREQGFARDTQEIAEGLVCLAVPVIHDGEVSAAISASFLLEDFKRHEERTLLEQLREAAGNISALAPSGL